MNPFKCFLVSLLAGLCTTVGGVIAIKFHRSIEPVPFAAALAFAAGVMVMVSFVELYEEGKEHLTESMGDDELTAKSVALALFLLGWLSASVADGVLHITMPSHHQCGSGHVAGSRGTQVARIGSGSGVTSKTESPRLTHSGDRDRSILGYFRRVSSHILNTPLIVAVRGTRTSVTKAERDLARLHFREDQSVLTRLGYFTAFVLALHNVPEGIATFFSANTRDPRIGINMAIAVGIHNIPEGIAVAVPIYFGTERADLAIWYTFLSGMAEPIGGLLAWFLLKNDSSILSPAVLGVALMLTCGIMVNVALKELLATALRYDIANEASTTAFFAGMVVMSVSLVALGHIM